MANLYLRSTDGSAADNGSTWALALATISGVSAIDAAGDVVYVSQAHAESVASSSNAWAGTNANPVRIIGGDDAAEPPTATSTAPTITVTGTTFTWTGAVFSYGLNWRFSSASSWTPNFNNASGSFQRFENCSFYMTTSNSGAIFFGNGSGTQHGTTELSYCSFRFAGTGQYIGVSRDVTILGGAWASGGTSPTNGVFNIGTNARATRLRVEGFDFTALSSTVNLVYGVAEGACQVVFRNCQLPASWTGSLVRSGQMKMGSRVEMHNCDNADTHYRLWVEDFFGTIKHETTIVCAGGASDGTTPLSWRMVSTADVAYPLANLVSPEIVRLNTAVGSAITVTVEVVTDGVTLTDAECWLELQYLGTSGFPLSTITSNSKTILATAANQTSSSATWTTTGLASPIKQSLSVTVTPQEAGYLHAVVRLAKASTTVYVDPKLTVT